MCGRVLARVAVLFFAVAGGASTSAKMADGSLMADAMTFTTT